MSADAASPNKAKLDALIARLAAAKSAQAPAKPGLNSILAAAGAGAITLDSAQAQFVSISSSLPRTSVLVGAAGTGKSTSMDAVCHALIESGKIPPLSSTHKHLTMGSPGIVVCSFTNRAVNVIRKKLSPDLQGNCATIHKLLEYAPDYEEYVDANGDWRTRRIFKPTRCAAYPLPSSIRCIIFEESSMIGLDLYNQIIDAFPGEKPAMIFLGDINQIPPVFGPSILGYKMAEALEAGTFVELTQVHRQAADNPIIKFAHEILNGRAPRVDKRIILGEPEGAGGITLIPILKCLTPDTYIHVLANQLFAREFEKGNYSPMEDLVLMPFNKSAGTIELNKYIAGMYARARGVEIYEISTTLQNLYFSLGDRVIYGKVDCVITDISPNPAYLGKATRAPSRTLDYWGTEQGTEHHIISDAANADDLDFLSVADAEEDGIASRQASHILTLAQLDSPDVTYTLQTTGEINNILLSYAITVHKAQGSEAEKVWCCFHRSHATMLSRELLYTAITRAKKNLVIVSEPDSLVKACAYQEIKGASIYEKAELFKGKKKNGLAPKW